MTSQTPIKRRWFPLIASAIGIICLLGAIGVAGTIYYFRNIRVLEPGPSVESPTPGTEMILIETARSIDNGITTINYELKTSGISAQKGFTLFYYPTGRKDESSAVEVEIDASGRVVEPNSTHPFVARMSRFGKGQWFLFGLFSSDEKIQVFAKGGPFPIVSTGDNGCKISVELADESGTTFIIQGEGFTPQEILKHTSYSGGEILNGTINVLENGKFRLIMLPAVIGKQSGTNKIKFIGQKCEVTVEYEWGLSAIENKQ